VERPLIISRKEWSAKPPRGEGQDNSGIDRITIHHTAVVQNTKLPIEKKLQKLQHFSQTESKLASGKTKPAWLDVPYHFYISCDGKIAEGRPITIVSDTNTEYDPARHATIVLEGNFETEQPTAEQSTSLTAMVVWLSAEHHVSPERIGAHNDFAKTACPGVNLKATIPTLRKSVEQLNGKK
jgi:hypothetical protein